MMGHPRRRYFIGLLLLALNMVEAWPVATLQH
jgi:hypothetical protein